MADEESSHFESKLREIYKLATGADRHEESIRFSTKSVEWRRSATVFIEGVLCFSDRSSAVDSLYVDPTGFNAFCNEGGNVQLYKNLTQLLALELSSSTSLLDIGCGSGRALLPALQLSQADRTEPLKVTAIEPSEASLELCRQALSELSNVEVHPVAQKIQQFIAASAEDIAFDTAVATFSISSQPRSERLGILRWTKNLGARLLLAEFDCHVPNVHATEGPELADVERFDAILERYVAGAAEHRGSPNERVILEGFLYPTFLGNFSSGPKFTFEQSKDRWLQELAEAGYSSIDVRFVSPFWWSDCLLFVCRA